MLVTRRDEISPAERMEKARQIKPSDTGYGSSGCIRRC